MKIGIDLDISKIEFDKTIYFTQTKRRIATIPKIDDLHSKALRIPTSYQSYF